ncbi:unnamed protein product [Paramecium octaurelia]|uniref:Thioredoxin domain-containing protein n=1 Tax=Paramecium octaurelia TaxID=43137 RepID=A0A8S1Y841_PAROT|nr:unnamed protein product [Paramecium octaurelia]
MEQVIQVTTSTYSKKVNKEVKAALIFVGDILAETGQLWCSDTVDAETTIKNYAIPQFLLKLDRRQGNMESSKQPCQSVRVIQIKQIPTLLLVYDNKEGIGFEEEQLFIENAFLEQ